MQEFSLESVSEKIYFDKTKEYFREVLSSYHNNNYRSSVVMLWSVVVCDILYKLQHLVNLHNDPKAIDILNKIKNIQESNPKSSEWEMTLIEESWRNTELINNIEYVNLEYLQKQRHLSAHPVLGHDSELHSPSKETVRALLRNSLENVLIKPPFYTKKIFDELVFDIANNSSVLQIDSDMKRYLESKYLNKMRPETEIKIFQSLWKLVFKLDDENCARNRLINFSALKVIINRNIALIKELIQSENEFFSNISEDSKIIDLLIEFISGYSFIYPHLTESARIKINHVVNNTENGRTMGWFTKPNIKQYYEDLIQWIKRDNLTLNNDIFIKIKNLFDSFDGNEWDTYFCNLVSTYYGSSCSFDQADRRFSVIASFFNIYDKDSFNFLLSEIETNNQTRDRRRARTDHDELRREILNKYNDFDFSQYPNFKSTFE